MSVAIKKLEGVEKVDVSLEKGSALVVLGADNKITLPQLRRIIRSSGYPTRDAQITARGRIAEQNGKSVLDLLNGSVLELAAAPADPPAQPVEVTGVSQEIDPKTERLTIKTVKSP